MSLLDRNLSSIPLCLFQVYLKNIVKYTNETENSMALRLFLMGEKYYTLHNGYINKTCNLNIKHFTGATVSLWLLWWRVWREDVVESSLEDSCQEQVTYVLDLWWGIHREVWPSQALCCSWCHQALSLCWMWKSLCLSIRSSQTCHYTYR